MAPAGPSGAPSPRVTALDALRGLAVISMVGFHASYDLAYIYGVSMPWFTVGAFQDVWRCSISWTFLFLAGWATSFSRNNLKRAAVYGAAALLVFAATSLAAVDAAVNFGILYCMAACTLLFILLDPLMERLPAAVLALLFICCFFATYQVPHARYEVVGLAWLGFPSPGFSSGDYYPLLPYCFLYLAGSQLARFHRQKTGGAYPAWMTRGSFGVLGWVGRHSLIVYLLHQPLILLVLELVFGG